MNYVRLGQSGLMVSRIGLGAMGFGDKTWREWVLNKDDSHKIVRRALDKGINFFDSCDYYSAGASEVILGQTLLRDVHRHEIVLATKVGMNMGGDPNARGFSRKHLFHAVDQSLKRLGTDYIDLYQTHIWDPTANIEEMMDAFDALVTSGKVLYVGATDMPAWQFSEALHYAKRTGKAPFVSMQNHYNLLFREHERELLPLCRANGIGLIPYSPMGRGFLAGNRDKEGWGETIRAKSDDFAQNVFFRDVDFEITNKTVAIAGKHGVKAVQIALAWVLQQEGIAAPIFGATDPDHIDDAVSALEIQLENSEMIELEASYESRPLPTRKSS